MLAGFLEIDMRIMDDVNLSRVVMGEEGTSVCFELIDMQQGAPIGIIHCENVLLFNFHSVMDMDGFAVYVGQVDVDEYHGDMARAKLAELGFCFRDSLGRTSMTESGIVHHLHIEGGEICVDVCCGGYHYVGSSRSRG